MQFQQSNCPFSRCHSRMVVPQGEQPQWPFECRHRAKETSSAEWLLKLKLTVPQACHALVRTYGLILPQAFWRRKSSPRL